MSCRTRSGSSAAITIARMLSGLDDQQTISVFHRVTHDWATNGSRQQPLGDEHHATMQYLRDQIRAIPGLTTARAASILRRIDAMEFESYTVGELQAIRDLVSSANQARNELDEAILHAASVACTSTEEVRRYVEETITSVRESGRSTGPSRRQRMSNRTISDAPSDRGTVTALDQIQHANITWRCESCGRFRDPNAHHVCPDTSIPTPPPTTRARRQRARQTAPPPRPLSDADQFDAYVLGINAQTPPESPGSGAHEDTRLPRYATYMAAQARRQAEWEATERSSWSTDEGGMDLFQAAYNAARERKANGEPAVPLDLDSPGIPGRKFGVEIEFNLTSRTAEVKDRIIRRMIEAGIFEPGATWERYHGISRQRRANGEEVFSVESDCTVDGEFITPILEDTPENWRKIATICQILKEEGAITGAHGGNDPPGGHIHVSLDDFDHGVPSHDAILNTWGVHGDTLWRLSSHPDRAHRDPRFCSPSSMHYGPHDSVQEVRRYNSGHHTTINFESTTGEVKDHVEYRAWDETLDPGVMQAQVRLSLAITEAALRDPTPTGAPIERIGTHLEQYRGRRLSGEEWRGATAPVRRLVDHLFANERHKEQIASLFTTTRWQRAR